MIHYNKQLCKKSPKTPRGQSEVAAIRRRTNNTMAKKKIQKDKQRSAKHYTEYQRSSNTNLTKTWCWTHAFRKGNQFLLH